MGTKALEGVRILEIGIAYAVPCATKMLADMGAEVIKVESHQRMDTVRVGPYPDNKLEGRYWDASCWYQATNPNKMGITINLNKPEGIDLVRRLVKISDVVVENFAPRVMKNFGLAYESLREIKPDIIMLSSSGFGHSGPWEDYVIYGWALEPMTISHLTGYADGPPLATAVPYTDMPAALYGAFSILAALEHRRKTGEGQCIDISQYEVGVSTIGEAVLDYTMNGRVQARMGNRHPFMAPHGCYRCLGEDQWITIAVSTDTQWEALCRCMGDPDWTRHERFSDALSRWKHQDELDRGIEQWTASQDKHAAMRALQEAGVAAGAVLTIKELLLDPHYEERRFFQFATSPASGTRPYPGPWFKMSKTPGSIRSAAPNLGQDNPRVFGGLLGLTEEQIRELEAKGVISENPPQETADAVANQVGVVPLPLQVDLGILAGYDEDYAEILGLGKGNGEPLKKP